MSPTRTEAARAIPDYSLGCPRHVAASLVIETGADPKMVMARMGHSSIKVTYDIYGHVFAERQNDSALADASRRG